MVEPNITPQWLTTGRTTLVAKKKETQDPSNYPPITCLPIIYKIHTSVITSRITHHIETNNIIPTEQKGNSTNTFGTIDQLLINKMIQEDAKKKKKTFNSVDRLQKGIWLGTPQLDNRHLKDTQVWCNNNKLHWKTMKNWKTSLHLTHTNGEMSTPEFAIKTGIFQGDSPSGLFLILCSGDL